MNAIWPLWATALALLLLAMAVLIWPLMHETETDAVDGRTPDAPLRHVYQVQREELEREFERQMMSPSDREQALEELQRRLLDDTDALSPSATALAPSQPERAWVRRGLAGLLALALPLAALALYLKVGDPQAAATIAAAEPQSHANSGVNVESMVSGLAAKLAQSPDDLEGWMVLARSHEVQEDFNEASDAYRQAIAAAERGKFPVSLQARLHADLADAQASAQDGLMEGPVQRALEDALRLDPLQPKALALAGTAAVRRGDIASAKQHWQQLLAQLEPGTDMALRVQSDLQRLEGVSRPEGSGSVTVTPSAPALSGMQGTISLSPAMAERVQKGDTLFVVARAAETGRIPLAALKLDVGKFPMAFQLDDRHAMSPELRLSRFKEVTVEAWVTRSGAPQKTSGLPTSAPRTTAYPVSGVNLLIDQIVP